MRAAIRIIQVFVGLLFIVSGLVKANDPLGLSYKMQEFFEIWNASLASGDFFARKPLMSLFSFLHDHSVFLSVTMITLEIVAGVALLLGWRKKPVLYLLLVLIVFFTFLTGYAFLSKNADGSPKFTNCGCFGDCLPITPLTSFIKDIVLLVLIALLIAGQRYIEPVFPPRARLSLLVASLLLTLLLQWYALNYLPPVDCLPFKQGNSIPEKMKAPPGSVPDSIVMRFIYEKNGKQYEFALEELPADLDSYTYKDRVDRLVRKGNADPPIKGFSLAGSDVDSTQIILGLPRALIGFALSPENPSLWMSELKKLVSAAGARGIPVYMASAEKEELASLLASNGLNIPVFSCDYTVIRTAARTNPTFYFLESGTIRKKYSHRELNKAVEYVNQQ
ncbi:MAG TPA: BT_3928 family protein [Flavisolibacter sp.]|nr:BT_3928 family protein [Flavisolibacter sp.]